jgi:hypothetical protein
MDALECLIPRCRDSSHDEFQVCEKVGCVFRSRLCETQQFQPGPDSEYNDQRRKSEQEEEGS